MCSGSFGLICPVPRGTVLTRPVRDHLEFLLQLVESGELQGTGDVAETPPPVQGPSGLRVVSQGSVSAPAVDGMAQLLETML